MQLQEAIQAVTRRQDLTGEQMRSVMQQIMTGQATQAQIGGFLIGLGMKGETVDEIAAAASVMRELVSRVDLGDEVEHLVDTCGTGGDGSATFNVSTASAFVAAGAGARVAKHGNRSVSSRSGSADLLEAAGLPLSLSPTQVATCVREAGVGFMFAPAHHAAMKHAIGPRREMGVRTIFNLLGPLTNPANAPNQLIGVFDSAWVEPLAQVLRQLGSRHVLVVHGEDGLDEITLGANTRVAELKNGEVTRYTLSPERFDIRTASSAELRVDSAAQSLEILNAVLADQAGPAREVVILNAGAAIYVAGVCDSIEEGVERARDSIASGAARKRLDKLIAVSQRLAATSS
ncbi:MAG: anthranilate phosphoribosyltransferase [Gammaproteobacteria bacterium]|nr:anthranilate phosphoribosyltransferase [Gammaproteobacteria bacterium]